jgi:hypothetical protein
MAYASLVDLHHILSYCSRRFTVAYGYALGLISSLSNSSWISGSTISHTHFGNGICCGVGFLLALQLGLWSLLGSALPLLREWLVQCIIDLQSISLLNLLGVSKTVEIGAA